MQDPRAGLSAETLADLAAAGRVRRFEADAAICRQGEPADRIDLIRSGRALATVTTAAGAELALGFLSAGQLVGEMAVLPDAGTHVATVTAVEETVTVSLTPAEFRQAQQRHPELSTAIIQALAERLDDLSRSVVDELSGRAEDRVLRRLLTLAGRSAAAEPLVLTQEELGRFAGVARGTVNRVLRHEEEVGTVALGRGRITVLDPAALEARLGGPAGRGRGDAASHAAGAEERRLLTAVVVGLQLETGDQRAEELGATLGRYQDAVAGALEAHGGISDGFHGDTAVALFGQTQTIGHDPQLAVQAAAAAVEAVQRLNAEAAGQVRARAGVEMGTVLTDPAAPGRRIDAAELVQRAAQLRSQAGWQSVLVGPVAHEATHRTIAYESSGAGWVYSSAAPPRRALPLIGRTSEMALLWSSWDAVVSERRTRLVTVLGPPGIGKSRLAAELAERAEAFGARVVYGRSQPFGGGLGYAALGQMIGSVAGISSAEPGPQAIDKIASSVRAVTAAEPGDVAHHLALMAGLETAAAGTDQQRLFRSACIFVEALGRDRPTLLVFEDLHWGDASDQDLVEALAARLRNVPVMLLVLARPELLDRRPNWSGGLASAATIELEGLNDSDAALLLGLHHPRVPSPDVLRRVLDAAGGNPLFLEELAAGDSDGSALTGDLPGTVVNAIAARLDALPPDARSTLVSASVVGRTFWRAAISRLTQQKDLDGSLDVLLSRGLIRREAGSAFPPDEEFSFKHILVRDVAYGLLTPRAREEAHARVARFLESWGRDGLGSSAALLAHHWGEAGQRERALRYLVEAADRAAAAAAHEEAVLLLSEAVEMTLELGREGAGELRARLGISLARLGRWREAKPELEAADGLGPASVDRQLQVLVELAQVCHWLLDLDGCRASALRAIELARSARRPDLEAAALGALAMAESSTGDVQGSLHHMQAAIAAAGEHRSQLMGPTHELTALTLYWIGKPHEAVVQGEAALRLGEEFADVNTGIRALGNLGLALAGAGRYADALQTFNQARTFAGEHGTGTFLARALSMCGGVHLDILDFEGARDLAEEARELALSLGFPLPVVSSGLDLMFNWARLGEVGKAEALIPQVGAAVTDAQGAHGWLWRLRFAQARAETAAARGDWAEARQQAADALERARQSGRAKYEVAALGVAARGLANSGDRQGALRDARAALDLAEAAGDPALRLRAAAVVLELEPGPEASASRARAAAEILRELPAGILRDRFTGAAGTVQPAVESRHIR